MGERRSPLLTTSSLVTTSGGLAWGLAVGIILGQKFGGDVMAWIAVVLAVFALAVSIRDLIRAIRHARS